MKKLNKTEYPMFVPLCVLCFQRQPLVCMGKAAAVWVIQNDSQGLI